MIMLALLVVCLWGITTAQNGYIISGTEVTTTGKYPWQGSLRGYGGHKCGIALISSTWGVTSAYCVNAETVNELTVLLGSNKRTDSDADVFPIKRFIMHEDYLSGDGNRPNDIAVVEFLYPVSGDNIATVPLPEKGAEHSGNGDCWIMGWGDDTRGGYLSDKLREANMEVQTNTKCKEFWAEDIIPGHVCVTDPAGQKTPCDGDSGGPLVCKVNGRYELVGTRSWGIVSCYAFVPSVYTRVANYRDWIKEKTGV